MASSVRCWCCRESSWSAGRGRRSPATGIVLGAAYMLWLYQRTMFGRVDNPANASLADLNGREVATLVPLVALAIWIGIYPGPVLRRLDASVGRIVVRVNSVYGPAIARVAADCNAAAAPVQAPTRACRDDGARRRARTAATLPSPRLKGAADAGRCDVGRLLLPAAATGACVRIASAARDRRAPAAPVGSQRLRGWRSRCSAATAAALLAYRRRQRRPSPAASSRWTVSASCSRFCSSSPPRSPSRCRQGI